MIKISNIPKKINSILEKFIEGAKNILGNRMKKIILYGSYARGDYKKDSDIDIMRIRAERMNSLLSSIETGDGDRLSTSLFNLLSEVTRERLPYIDELIARMQELGAEAALMSGSGPTVYGLFKDRESCERAKEALNSELEAGRLSDLIETEFLKSEERMLL